MTKIYLMLCSLLALTAIHVYAGEEGLTIEAAIKMALDSNERPKIADEGILAAEARVKKARTLYYPYFSISGGYGLRGGSGNPSSSSSGDLTSTALLTVPLYNARTMPLYRKVKIEYDAVKLTAYEEKRLLAFETADAFLQVLIEEQVLAAAGRRLEFARQTLDDTSIRFEAEIVSSNAVTRTSLELAAAEQEAALAEGRKNRTRLGLGHLINSGVTGSLVVPDSLLSPHIPASIEKLIIDAHSNRKDIAVTRAKIEALKASIEETEKRGIPVFNLTGQFGENLENVIKSSRESWQVGINLNWQLYDGGASKADRAEIMAEERAQTFELQAVERRIELDIKGALIDMENAAAVTKHSLVAVETGKKNLDEISKLYHHGLASALEVSDANLRLFEAEDALARARYGQAVSSLTLRAALGLWPLGS